MRFLKPKSNISSMVKYKGIVMKIMDRIKVLFLSTQPCVLAAFISFFSNDPFISLSATDYENFNDFKEIKIRFSILIFDDASFNRQEIEKITDTLFNLCMGKKILYTGNSEKSYLLYFKSQGIDGIVSKRSSLEGIKQAIIKINDENVQYLDCNSRKILFEKDSYDGKILSPREKEVLKMVKKGFKNKEIAEKLFLSVKTVEVHKENIKEKLKLQRTYELYNV